MSAGKDWSAKDRRPSSVAWPITEIEETFFRKSLLGKRKRRCDGWQEALGERGLVSRSESAVRNTVSGKLKVFQSLQLPCFCHCLAKCSSWPCQNGGQSLWPYENVIRNLSSDKISIPTLLLVLCPCLQHHHQNCRNASHYGPEERLCAYNMTELRRASRPLTHSSRLFLW